MKPDNDVFLRTIAQALASDIIPQIPTSYGRADAAQMVEVLLAAAGDLDIAASRRFDENKTLRNLFSSAADTVTDGQLKQELLEASQTADDDIKISSLEKNNQTLSALLIKLHEHVEELEGEEPERIDKEIWQFLSARTMSRMGVVMAMAQGKSLVFQGSQG